MATIVGVSKANKLSAKHAMTDSKVLFQYKGYAYTSISLYPMDPVTLGYREENGKSQKIEGARYRVLAGRKEHSTPLTIHKGRNGWVLTAETPTVYDAVLEIFFFSQYTREDMRETVLKYLNDGFTLMQDPMGRVYPEV
jgi:hypothetical protein